MSFVVINCFHWIGYHIVEALIEEGEDVYGIEKPGVNNQTNLEMYVGRNSLFHHKMKRTENDSGPFIIVEDEHIIYQHNKEGCEQIITTFFVFGEWMPMNTHGMYQKDNYIRFASNEFKRNAIHINIFIEYLLQWIKNFHVNDRLSIRRTENNEYHCMIHKETVYLYDFIPLEKRIQKLVGHFKQFQDIYIEMEKGT